MSQVTIKIGIIGGSGLDDPDILTDRKEHTIDTPYGKPSDVLLSGKISNVNCVLLARHGRDHSVMPTNINYRANIYALKTMGCTHILATTACGSLQEAIAPGDIVFLDQFIDRGKTGLTVAYMDTESVGRTTKRHQTFYDGEATSPKGVCHIPMHDPFCKLTREVLSEAATELGIKHHKTGTVVTIEGPRFSSRAESKVWRMWGGDVINMTSVPEVVLAKEAGMSYASIAMATDYDCWRETGEAVSVKAVLATFKENVQRTTNILRTVIPKIVDKALHDKWLEILKKNKSDSLDSVMLSSKHNIEVVEIAGSLL